MSEYKDLLDMIEVITTAIEIQGRTGDSFRRYALFSTSEITKSLYLEIAEDFFEYRKKLQARKERLQEAFNDLRAVEQNGIKVNTSIAISSDPFHNMLGDYVISRQRDPICGMKVNEAECQYVSVFQGERYFFCCEDCQKAFELMPSKYVIEMR